MFAGGVDTTATETKGTVLIHSAEQVCFLRMTNIFSEGWLYFNTFVSWFYS